MVRALNQRACERCLTRANFYDRLSRSRIDRVDDPCDDAGVMQKVLAKALTCAMRPLMRLRRGNLFARGRYAPLTRGARDELGSARRSSLMLPAADALRGVRVRLQASARPACCRRLHGRFPLDRARYVVDRHANKGQAKGDIYAVPERRIFQHRQSLVVKHWSTAS